MAAGLLLPALAATAFTAGCAVIHVQRRHAEIVTNVLALMLFVLSGHVAVAVSPEPMTLTAMPASAGHPPPPFPCPDD